MESTIRGVTRREGRCPGWVVRRWDPQAQRSQYMRFFSDRCHNGTTRARLVAELLSVKEGDGKRMAQLYRRPRASKIGGLPVGVFLIGRRKDGTHRAVRASLTIDGERYFQDFEIKTGDRSYKAAVRKATDYRASLEHDAFGEV